MANVSERKETGRERRGGLRAVFAVTGYRWLWTARTLSQWGDVANNVALALPVLRVTGSGLGVAGVVAAEILPILLLAPLAGVVVDRLPRRGVMITADLDRHQRDDERQRRHGREPGGGRRQQHTRCGEQRRGDEEDPPAATVAGRARCRGEDQLGQVRERGQHAQRERRHGYATGTEVDEVAPHDRSPGRGSDPQQRLAHDDCGHAATARSRPLAEPSTSIPTPLVTLRQTESCRPFATVGVITNGVPVHADALFGGQGARWVARVRQSDALVAAKEFKEAGDEVRVIFAGAATKWPGILADPDHRAHRAYREVADTVLGACGCCARAFEAEGSVEGAHVRLVDEFQGHPSIRALVTDRFAVISI